MQENKTGKDNEKRRNHHEDTSDSGLGSLKAENEEECEQFLEDLMTKKEMTDISQRLEVAKMISEQAVYNRIVEARAVSIHRDSVILFSSRLIFSVDSLTE